MSRRLLSLLPAVFWLASIAVGADTRCEGGTKMAKLENDLYLLEIDRGNGSIKRVYDKRGKIDLITEPRLAESFRLLLPLGRRQQDNYILGRDQRLTTLEEKP